MLAGNLLPPWCGRASGSVCSRPVRVFLCLCLSLSRAPRFLGSRLAAVGARRALGIIKGAVPVRHIARGVDFATDIARAGQPVVLRGTAAESWPAMSRWADMVELGARLGVITNAQYYRGDQACMFRYWHDEHPLANVPGIAAAYRRVSNSFVNMSGPEYLARVARQVDMYADAHPPHDIECTYYGAPLHNTPELQRDCVPIDEFAVRARPTVTQLWLGAAGLTTHLHYDTSDNFFVQVTGHKRFLLFPPSSSRALYLFPYLHPMHQSSQVDLLRPDLAEFPLFREAHALEVRLSPGDVLFLPTLWGHHVVSEDANAALSIWTYPPEHDGVVASRAAPLPLPTQYRSRVRRALTMRLFLDAMLEAVLGRGRGKIGAAELVRAAVLRRVVVTCSYISMCACVSVVVCVCVRMRMLARVPVRAV